MTTQYDRLDPTIWRPQARFQVDISSHQKLRAFNETGGIAVFIGFKRSIEPDIRISGSQSQTLSFWRTSSRSGFVTKPKFSAGLLTIRFVKSGQISYLRRDGETIASPSIAVLTGFDDLLELHASAAVDALSATMPVSSLVSANEALTGVSHQGLSDLEPVADMATPGMSALFCTVRSIQRYLQSLDQQSDLMLPLLQEVMSYQLLSAWPKRTAIYAVKNLETGSRPLRLAIDYIAANLPTQLTLAEVAAAAGISVRALQSKFKKELGRTPIQFIIEQRLAKTHREFFTVMTPERSINDIARSWGFIHMSDFTQRYRRQFGCTPSQTRSHISRSRRREVN